MPKTGSDGQIYWQADLGDLVIIWMYRLFMELHHMLRGAECSQLCGCWEICIARTIYSLNQAVKWVLLICNHHT